MRALNIAIMLMPVVLPVVFWAAYHWHADRHLPEPPGHLLAAFALGVMSFYLGIMLYMALDVIDLRRDAFELARQDLPGLFLYAILAIGPIEELAKMTPFLLVVLRFREFNEPIDGIIYASFIALGFSAVENIKYLQFLGPAEAFARGFAGPVIHIVFASVWGYLIGKAWLSGKPMAVAVPAALALTGLLHGLYNFIVMGLPGYMLPISAALITAIWIWRMRLIRDLHANSLRHTRSERA